MMGGIKAQYDCIKALSETDFTEDLKAIRVPTFILNGDDDQIVPIADSSLLSVKLPHGMCTTHPDPTSTVSL
jgi:non-heme chloroperoxidase